MSKVEHYSQFKAANRPKIIALASQIGAIDGEVHWDLIEEMKSVLGAEAANASTDDEGSQDEAIARAESWVTDHCSGGSIEEDVAMALWLRGFSAGESYLVKNKASESANAEPMGESPQG